MNIFPISSDPAESAAYLDDARVIKIAHDVTRILCMAVHANGGPQLFKSTQVDDSEIYYATQAASHLSHFAWLMDYALSCYREHYKRTGHAHKNGRVLLFLAGLVQERSMIPNTEPKRSLTIWTSRDSFMEMPNLTPIAIAADTKQDLDFRWATQSREPLFYGKPDPRITALREA